MKTKPKTRKASVWFCPSCVMSGEAPTRVAARNTMVRHFMSDAHIRTSEALEMIDVYQRIQKKLSGRGRI